MTDPPGDPLPDEPVSETAGWWISALLRLAVAVPVYAGGLTTRADAVSPGDTYFRHQSPEYIESFTARV